MKGKNEMLSDDTKSVLLEEYCNECDEVLHQAFSTKAFYNCKVGRLRCPKCGAVMVPCNECEDHDACNNCPWKDAEICDAMSDEAYIHYLRDIHPTVYEMFRSGKCGDYYRGIIEKIEGSC